MKLFGCPICGHTAEVQDRLRSEQGGRITHVTVACLGGHWLILSVEEADELIRRAKPHAS